jgi:hypothetical protein
MLKIKPKLTKENILKKTRESDIFNYYCPYFNKGFFPGEFRTNKSDKHPSAKIFLGRDGRWRYSDFGEAGTYDCFAYVGKKFNLGFLEALDKINKEMNLGLGELQGSPSSSPLSFKELKPKLITETSSLSTTIIKVKRREYQQRDKDYWYGKYYITEELFNYYNNFPIQTYWIFKDNKESFPYKPKDITYTQDYYKDDTGIFRRKIYRPFSDYKWTSNITGLVVQGIKRLPKYGEKLIITKSMKDLMVMKVLGYQAIATNNETSWIPDKVRLDLESRFTEIFINFDNDDTGLEMGNYIASTYGYTPIFTEDYDLKDPSDFIEVNGPKITKEFFNELTNG